VPLEEDHELDPEFWRVYRPELSRTPLYYRPFLQRLPHRAAAVVAVIADAEPAGVLVHCAAGRDRTGPVVALLLALVGVDAAIIAADHELSAERAAAPDETPAVRAALDRHGIGWQAAMIAALDELDVQTLLLDAGVTRSQLAAVRARPLDPPVLISR
jgi:protein-tyrosine phosphatase